MKLYSYKLTHETGFAPNPFGGLLTLATCKPGMRRKRLEGEWIAGFTSKELNRDEVGHERLIYLMQVKEKIAIADYHSDLRFRMKIPKPNSKKATERAGDNIYRPISKDASDPDHFEQLPNCNHWDGKKHVVAARSIANAMSVDGMYSLQKILSILAEMF